MPRTAATSVAASAFYWRSSELKCSAKNEHAPGIARISYISTVNGSSQAALQHVEKILSVGRRVDAGPSISGQLCYDEQSKSLWQVIEGSTEDVADVWGQILTDKNLCIDQNTIVVEKAPAERKYPPGWGLKCLRIGGGADHASCATQAATGIMQLTYKSMMRDCGEGERQVVEDIIPGAIENNVKRGITSWMLYNDCNLTVCQVLEGHPDSVEQAFTAIANDPRHDVVFDSVRRRMVAHRDFANRPMAVDTVEQGSQQCF